MKRLVLLFSLISVLFVGCDAQVQKNAQAPKQAQKKECKVQAEDGSWVPCSFYSKPCTVQAEDGSWVPCSFYSKRSN